MQAAGVPPHWVPGGQPKTCAFPSPFSQNASLTTLSLMQESVKFPPVLSCAVPGNVGFWPPSESVQVGERSARSDPEGVDPRKKNDQSREKNPACGGWITTDDCAEVPPCAQICLHAGHIGRDETLAFAERLETADDRALAWDAPEARESAESEDCDARDRVVSDARDAVDDDEPTHVHVDVQTSPFGQGTPPEEGPRPINCATYEKNPVCTAWPRSHSSPGSRTPLPQKGALD